MSESTPEKSPTNYTDSEPGTINWGPALFLATLAGVLVFFWWMLIYSGGVEVHHG